MKPAGQPPLACSWHTAHPPLRGVTPQTAATRDLGSGDSADHMRMDQIVSQPSSLLLKDI